MRNTNNGHFAFSIINTSSVSVRQSSERAHMNSHHMCCRTCRLTWVAIKPSFSSCWPISGQTNSTCPDQYN